MSSGVLVIDGPVPGSTVCIAGRRPAIAGAHAQVAFILASYAYALRFSAVRTEASRLSGSLSIYLSFTDAKRRRWLLRLSDHRARRSAENRARPHFDLVSYDGNAGFDEALAFMGSVADGTREWFDPDILARPPRAKRRPKTRRGARTLRGRRPARIVFDEELDA